MTALVKRLFNSATMMYVAALAMSGFAILVSVALPPHERGLLVATTISATVGVAIGGLSIETFFLARGRAWLQDRAGRRSLAVYATTVPLSAALGWLFASYSAEATPTVSALGATLIAAATVPGAAGLAFGDFVGVYRWRAIFAAVTPVLYIVLALASIRRADVWLLAWVLTQALMAVAMWVRYSARFAAMARRRSTEAERLDRMGLTHTGAVAQIFTYRFDQLSLSRYQGPDDLAVYSLAVAAIEFSTAGAVVAAQRALGDHEQGSGDRLRGGLRKAVLYAVGMGALVLVGLAGLGLVVGGYRGALLLGALLLPRSLAVAIGKVLSARLVNLGGERMTATIAVCTAVVAIVGYTLVVGPFGAPGVAIVSVGLFAAHATATAWALRSRPAAPAGSQQRAAERVEEHA
jgi:hypothetical protein